MLPCQWRTRCGRRLLGSLPQASGFSRGLGILRTSTPLPVRDLAGVIGPGCRPPARQGGVKGIMGLGGGGPLRPAPQRPLARRPVVRPERPADRSAPSTRAASADPPGVRRPPAKAATYWSKLTGQTCRSNSPEVLCRVWAGCWRGSCFALSPCIRPLKRAYAQRIRALARTLCQHARVWVCTAHPCCACARMRVYARACVLVHASAGIHQWTRRH